LLRVSEASSLPSKRTQLISSPFILVLLELTSSQAKLRRWMEGARFPVGTRSRCSISALRCLSSDRKDLNSDLSVGKEDADLVGEMKDLSLPREKKITFSVGSCATSANVHDVSKISLCF
jgi:hypothetical protein